MEGGEEGKIHTEPPCNPPPHLVQNDVGVLVHVALVDQLLKQHASGDKGQPSLLAHVAVHAYLVSHQRAQGPPLSVGHKLGHALGSDAARLGADDVAVFPGLHVFAQDELGHLGALAAARGALDDGDLCGVRRGIRSGNGKAEYAALKNPFLC